MTFSQLLVKTHRNEEEEITSKVVNKNVTVGNNPTLEQRVDSLIAKSNRNQASPNSPKGTIVGIMVNPLFSPIKDLGEITDHPLATLKEISDKI